MSRSAHIHHSISRAAAAFALLATLALLFPLRAAGHAVLVRSDPPDGAALATAPSEARLFFSESIVGEFTTVVLAGPDGVALPITVSVDPGDDTVVVVDLPELDVGTYRMTWTALSREDLHDTTGWTVFGIRETVEAAGLAAGAGDVDVVEGIVRWVEFASLAALVGALVVLLHLMRPATAAIGSLLRRAAIVAVGLAALSAIVGLVLHLAAIASAGRGIGGALGAIPGTGFGQRAVVEVMLLAAIAFILRRASAAVGPGAPRGPRLAPGLLVIGVFVARAMSSHQAAADGSTVVDVLMSAAHSMAAATWIGSMTAIAVVGLSPAGRSADGRNAVLGALRRFGVVAALSVGVLAASGLYAAGHLVSSIDSLLFTNYGRLLLAKLLITGVVGLLGLRHAARLHGIVRHGIGRLGGWAGRVTAGAARTGSLVASVRLETAGALTVALLATLMSVTTPANGPEYRPAPPVPEPVQTALDVDDLLLTAAVRPGRAGQNFVTLGLYETLRPPLAPIGRVAAVLTPIDDPASAVTLEATPVGDGRWDTAAGTLPIAGDWRLQIVVERTGLPDAVASTEVAVEPAPAPTLPVVISHWPLAPLFFVVSALLWLGLGLIVVAWRGRVPRRGRATVVAAEHVPRSA